MNTLKLLSSFKNKIGKLTNRKNNKQEKIELIYIKSEKDLKNIIQKIIEIFEQIKLQNDSDKNIEKLLKYFESIEISILDFSSFNIELYKYLFKSDLISTISENINIYSNKLLNAIIIFIQKIIFLDEIYKKKKINEEAILTNIKIVSFFKQIIFEFDNILKKINNIDINSDLFLLIKDGILPFLNELFINIIKYPNLYLALIENSSTLNINLELQLLDILYILFKFEPQIKDRTSRTFIRKNLLRFFNNFNFQNKKEIYKKFINQSILNLVDYYQNFLLLCIKDLDNNYKIINNFPLDLTENDIMQLTSDDTISYLQFFNILINNFLDNELKIYLIDLLYNNFLCKYILEEIMNISNDQSYKARSTLLIEYIYFLSLCIHNYDINILFFYFFFGFNFELDQENNINNINFRKIISKSNNNYEAIRAYFTLIFDSNNTNLLILLMKTLTNFVKRIPYLFISEMVSPFYLFYLNKNKLSENNFEDVLDNLTKNSEKISLLEVIKILLPQNFGISPQNWLKYFIKNLEMNYYKNINNLNQMENIITNGFNNDNSFLNKSGGNSNSNNVSYNYKNILNISSYTFSDYNNNNDSIISFKDNNLNESIFGNQTIKDNELINISPKNKFSYILNNITCISRVKFFEMFLKKFKNFVNNKYLENLYLSEFFLQIFSFLIPLEAGNDLKQLYNIYSWGAFAKKKDDKLFEVSAIGILCYIKNHIDKIVLNKFSKDEISKFDYLMNDNDNDIFDMNVDLNTELGKRIEFLKNIKLYNEIFKDFSSNIFAKILNDESNHYWIKGIKQNINHDNL